MKKEELKLSNIKNDLKIVAFANMYKKKDATCSFCFGIAAIIFIGAIFFKSILIGLLGVGSVGLGIFFAIRENKAYSTNEKAIEDMVEREDISIVIEKFSHVVEDVKQHGKYDTEYISTFYFMTGEHWIAPRIGNHYRWSKEYYISTQGLINISLREDEYYFVSVQGHHDIAYIYPCKFFTLDESLKKNNDEGN